MSGEWLRTDPKNGIVRFSVHMHPRASRNEIVGLQGEALKVRVTAPAIEGAAKAALIEFLADRLGVGRAAVHIVTGQHARRKLVEVVGIDAERVRRLVASVSTR